MNELHIWFMLSLLLNLNLTRMATFLLKWWKKLKVIDNGCISFNIEKVWWWLLSSMVYAIRYLCIIWSTYWWLFRLLNIIYLLNSNIIYKNIDFHWFNLFYILYFHQIFQNFFNLSYTNILTKILYFSFFLSNESKNDNDNDLGIKVPYNSITNIIKTEEPSKNILIIKKRNK